MNSHARMTSLTLTVKRTIAPVALRVAQADRVEAQHADAVVGELLTDASGGRRLLAKREPVRKGRPSRVAPLQAGR